MANNDATNGSNGHADEQPQGLVYPCEFPIKMFGKNELSFIAAVDAVVEQWVPREDWASSKQTPRVRFLRCSAGTEVERKTYFCLQICFLFEFRKI